MIHLSKKDDVYVKVDTNYDISRELSDHFSFEVDNFRFTPAYKKGLNARKVNPKAKLWDGKIRLYKYRSKSLYYGLIPELLEFAEQRGYEVGIDDTIPIPDPVSIEEIENFAKFLNPTPFPDAFQLKALHLAAQNRRCLLLSPTASGKSLIMWMMVNYFKPKRKMLIVVPRQSLVLQLKSDFESYCGLKLDRMIHTIMEGCEKDTNKKIIISTWQSIYEQPKEWFSQFGLMIGDECHTFASDCLRHIMENLIDCPYKFGMTGTLSESKTNEMVLRGLFGPIFRVSTTDDLIKLDRISKIEIFGVSFIHKQAPRLKTYDDERNYLIHHDTRNKKIVNLASNLKGNTLILFRNVEHGKELFHRAQKREKGKDHFLIYQQVPVHEREIIRAKVEKMDNAEIYASYGTFSTGINIRRINNIILAHPSKSKILILQSIGRGLRKHESKNVLTVYDIGDDLRSSGIENFTYQHFKKRLMLYDEAKFPFRTLKYVLEPPETVLQA